MKEADRLSENQYLHLLSHEFSLDLRKGPRSPVQQPPPFPSPQKRSCRCSDNTSNSLLRLHHCSHRGYLHSRTPHLLHLQSHLHLPLDSAPSMSYSSTSSSTALSHPRFHQCSHRGHLNSRTPHPLHLHSHLPLDSARSMSFSSTSSSTAYSHPLFPPL